MEHINTACGQTADVKLWSSTWRDKQ